MGWAVNKVVFFAPRTTQVTSPPPNRDVKNPTSTFPFLTKHFLPKISAFNNNNTDNTPYSVYEFLNLEETTFFNDLLNHTCTANEMPYITTAAPAPAAPASDTAGPANCLSSIFTQNCNAPTTTTTSSTACPYPLSPVNSLLGDFSPVMTPPVLAPSDSFSSSISSTAYSNNDLATPDASIASLFPGLLDVFAPPAPAPGPATVTLTVAQLTMLLEAAAKAGFAGIGSLAPELSCVSATPPPLMMPITTTTTANNAAAANAALLPPLPPARGRRNSGYECPVDGCEKVFSRRFNLKTHLSTHVANRSRPFNCNVMGCGKTFMRTHDLARHARRHSEIG